MESSLNAHYYAHVADGSQVSADNLNQLALRTKDYRILDVRRIDSRRVADFAHALTRDEAIEFAAWLTIYRKP